MSRKTSEHQRDTLISRMREDWDARVRSNYRVWMSDGYENDDVMWRSGERDLSLLLDGLDPQALKGQHAFELGCGVGRLLKPAAERFQHVTGCDVSEAALAQAHRFLSSAENVTFLQSNGEDLRQLADESFDLVFCFGTLANLPVRICCGYLSELIRVLKPGGSARLQMYLGETQQTVEEDTFGLRSYPEELVCEVLQKLGCDIDACMEVDTDDGAFSDRSAGLIAKFIFLTKERAQEISRDDVVSLLAPTAEQQADANWPGSEMEYRVAITKAQAYVQSGELEQALQVFEYAKQRYRDADPEIERVIAELRAALST